MKTKRNSDNIWERKDVEPDDGISEHTLAHSAAATGDIPLLVRTVQQDRGLLEHRDIEGRTPLAHAVHAQQLLATKRLVKLGADINAQDGDGRTGLSIAAYQGWHEGVAYLLRKGADQNIGDKSGRTPLHVSTYDTDSRSMCTLLQRLCIEEMNTTDNEKMTALHWAAFHNRPDHVRQLLARGGNPLAKDVDGKTSLHWAAQNGSRKCSALLMASVPELCLARCIDGAGKTPVHLAAAAGQVALLQDLAHCSSAILEAEDRDGRTPLHWAAAMGHADCVKALLHLGASPDHMDSEGGTPLEYAKQARHKRCCQLLEEKHPLTEVYSDRQPSSSLGVKSNKPSKNPVGFLKGLFHKKHKTSANNDRPIDSRSQLPAVVSNGNTGKGTSRDNSILEQASVGVHLKEKHRKRHKIGARDWDLDSVKTFDTTDTRDTRDTRDTEEGIEDMGKYRKHKKHRRKDKHKLETVRDSSRPKSIRTQSSWNDENNIVGTSHQSSVMKSVHLSPLGNTKAPEISPRIAQDSSALMYPEALALRRQGELSPLAEITPPDARRKINGQSLSSHLAVLRNERDGASRSPTPPPYRSLNMHTKRALPGISPLAARKMANNIPDIHPLDMLQTPSGGRHLSREIPAAGAGNSRVPPLASLHEESPRTYVLNNATDEPIEYAYANDENRDGNSRTLCRETSRAPADDVIPLYNLRQAINEASPDT